MGLARTHARTHVRVRVHDQMPALVYKGIHAHARALLHTHYVHIYARA